MSDGKPSDQTLAHSLAESVPDHAARKPDANRPDAGRRSLIRGAAGIAPVVITLRSGAVAAAIASCAGTKAVGTVAADGTITVASGSSPADGDHCIYDYQETDVNGNNCPAADPPKIVPISQSGGLSSNGGTVSSGKCSVSPGGAGTPVAITSASVASFL